MGVGKPREVILLLQLLDGNLDALRSLLQVRCTRPEQKVQIGYKLEFAAQLAPFHPLRELDWNDECLLTGGLVLWRLVQLGCGLAHYIYLLQASELSRSATSTEQFGLLLL